MRLLFIGVLALAATGCVDEGKASKVTMCHNTSSAKNPVVMITVANASQQTHHERHGDTVAPTWYADMDEDGLGDAADALVDCEQPDGYVDNPDDPDDETPDGDDDDDLPDNCFELNGEIICVEL